MAPEQALGKPVDKRADIWAFGCVLYELVTGRQAFTGEAASGEQTRFLSQSTEWTALPPETPASIRRVLRRCLQRDPQRRLRDIGDALLELEDPAEADVVHVKRAFGPQAAAGVILALVATALAAAAVTSRFRSASSIGAPSVP